MEYHTVIIGAGPAGLTAAYELSKEGVRVLVVERDPRYVGGISRTVVYKGYRFDIGGHRFFSKSREVEALWDELLPDDMLDRPRSSRIYYNGKFFDYPLKALDSLFKLGPFEAARCMASYLKAQLFPYRDPQNFEQWVVNRFGRRLFSIFFKTYTEKVWGMKCSAISADWAAQRIKGLSLYGAILNSLGLRRKDDKDLSTLITHFRYPRLGPGQMWERARDRILAMGNDVWQGVSVTSLHRDADNERWIVELSGHGSDRKTVTAKHVISTTALSELVPMMGDLAGADVCRAVSGLRYRDFLIVGLIAKAKEKFQDNWIYIHDPHMKVGRIQNFRSWSPAMVPDPSMACYGMEYFCFENDGLWNAGDTALIELARSEIAALSLCREEDIIDGCVIRQRKAYPVYDEGYAERVKAVAESFKARFPTLHLIGRNGMHKYNNQDHAMMTAMLTVRNIMAGRDIYDVWAVNQDAEYHEEGAAGNAPMGERLVPTKIQKSAS